MVKLSEKYFLYYKEVSGEMWAYIRKRTILFYSEMLTSYGLIIVFVSLIIAKTLSNSYHGMAIPKGILNGVLSFLPYLAGYYIICLFANDEKDIPEESIRVSDEVKRKGLIVSCIYFVIMFVRTVGEVYMMNTHQTHIESIIPGLNMLDNFLMNNIAVPISGLADFITPHQIYMIIKGNILYVLIPLLIFKSLGYKFKGMVFSMKHSRASWVIIAIMLVMFAVNGITLRGIWLLTYSVLYPGLCEEFLHRGIYLRTFSSFIQKRGNAVIAGTIFFMLMHIPTYYFQFISFGPFSIVTSLIQAMLMGIIFAYGYSTTGTLLPWILIHALEDVRFIL